MATPCGGTIFLIIAFTKHLQTLQFLSILPLKTAILRLCFSLHGNMGFSALHRHQFLASEIHLKH